MMTFLKTVLITALIIFLFVKLWPPLGRIPSAAKLKQYEKRNKFFYGEKFHTKEPFKILDVGAKSDYGKNVEKIPEGTIPVKRISKIPDAGIGKLKFIWFGHSTFLLQMHGLNIFADPVLSSYSSPIQGIGKRRFAEVPITADKMPEVDILLLTHDHYDHLDYNTIKDIDSKVKQYIVPLGVDCHLLRWGVDEKKIHVMSWDESINVKGLKITCTSGRHYTGRIPWHKNKTLWCGYYLKDNKHSVYYTGDTGYGSFFKDIYERFGEMDLVIMESGQYDKKWPQCHMEPEQAVDAAKILKGKWVIPIHWASFALAYHSWDEPIKRFTAAAEKEDIKFATPMIGEIVDYDKIDEFKNKWWLDVK